MTLALLLLVSFSGLLSGCALSEEDKDFYYRGWVRPTDLDREPPNRLGPKPLRNSPQGHAMHDPLVD